MTSPRKPRVGISACLLGREVRWDGGHKLEPGLLAALGPCVRWIPVCPEVELGLGVPREPVQLVGPASSPRLLGVESGKDRTAAMRRWVAGRLAELSALELDGWVTKARSPSCGLRRVPIRAARGGPVTARGAGVFARALRRRWPDLPIEEEGRLASPAVRARFLARVREHQRRRKGAPPAAGAARIARCKSP